LSNRDRGLVEAGKFLAKSPLMFQLLRLLQNKEATLTEITGQLKKTKSSASRALRKLRRTGLVEATKNLQNGRSKIFRLPEEKKDPVRKLLLELASSQVLPSRATSFLMADLEGLVEEVLKMRLLGWKITRTPKDRFNFALQRPRPSPIGVALKLKLGGQRFERGFYQTIGELLTIPELPQLIVVAVFGAVKGGPMSIVEDRLKSLLSGQGSAVKFLWLNRSPLAVDRDYITKEIVSKITRWANELPRT